MKTIWKYSVPIDGNVYEIHIPESFKILSVGNQNHNVVFWTEVKSDKELKKTFFKVVPTGGEIPKGGDYVGTTTIKDWQSADGMEFVSKWPFVAHLYRVFEK